MVLLLAALLGAAPVATPPPRVTARTGILRAQVDMGGLIIASWYVPQTRTHIEAAMNNARGMFIEDEDLDGDGLLLASPVFGPWLTASQGSLDAGDRALLYTTGVLQLIGLSLGAMRLFDPDPVVHAQGPVLSISPIAAGRVGLSVRIVGF